MTEQNGVDQNEKEADQRDSEFSLALNSILQHPSTTDWIEKVFKMLFPTSFDVFPFFGQVSAILKSQESWVSECLDHRGLW